LDQLIFTEIMTEFKAEELGQLLVENPYDTKILAQLEAAVEHQAKSGEYFFDVNRHVLKLYSVDPDAIKMDVVQKVLIMAMMQLPETHFLACKYLLKEDLHSDAELKGVFRLAHLLETAQFAVFWKEAADSKVRTSLDKCTGFDAAIRTFICTVLEATYQSIETDTLKELLNASQEQVDELAGQRGYSKTDDDKCLAFPLGVENQFPKVTTCESISLQDICKVLSLRA